MKALRTRTAGFSLIELMITVAILGVLTSVAIPNFVAMQLRAKRAEIPMSLDGIRQAEKSYEHEFDVFTSCVLSPTTLPQTQQVYFGASFGDNSSWDLLGWVADGKVRAQYQVTASNTTDVATRNFSALGISDMDGNGTSAVFVTDRDVKPIAITQGAEY